MPKWDMLVEKRNNCKEPYWFWSTFSFQLNSYLGRIVNILDTKSIFLYGNLEQQCIAMDLWQFILSFQFLNSSKYKYTSFPLNRYICWTDGMRKQKVDNFWTMSATCHDSTVSLTNCIWTNIFGHIIVQFWRKNLSPQDLLCGR